MNLAVETISRGALVREEPVQKISTATASIIVLIALYFTLSWGYEALRVLTSPSYGFEDVWRSQFLFGIGRLFDLGPVGLVKLSAFFATLKLAVACICALHIADRARCTSLIVRAASCADSPIPKFWKPDSSWSC